MVLSPFFYSNAFIERYLLDPEANWWVEIDEELWETPIIEFEFNTDSEPNYVGVNYDLEVRVNSILEIFKYSQLRNYCAERMAEKLTAICNANEEFELGSRITKGIKLYKDRLERERVEFETRQREWEKRKHDGNPGT